VEIELDGFQGGLTSIDICQNIAVAGDGERTIRLWDLRMNNKELATYKTMYDQAMISHLLSDDFLLIGERSDFVHLIDYKKGHIQTIDFFGNLTGVGMDHESGGIFIGIEE